MQNTRKAQNNIHQKFSPVSAAFSKANKTVGKITGLNPAIILLSLSVWGALMGIVGMIIALPCTSLMLSYYQRYIRIKEKEFSGGIEHTDFQHKENSGEK